MKETEADPRDYPYKELCRLKPDDFPGIRNVIMMMVHDEWDLFNKVMSKFQNEKALYEYSHWHVFHKERLVFTPPAADRRPNRHWKERLLVTAIGVNRQRYAEALINNYGADYNYRIRPTGHSAFHYAVENGMVGIMELCSTKGVDVNRPISGSSGIRAVHLAAAKGGLSAMRWLADNGAELTLRTDQGEDALDVAVRVNRQSNIATGMVTFLAEKFNRKMDVVFSSKQGVSPKKGDPVGVDHLVLKVFTGILKKQPDDALRERLILKTYNSLVSKDRAVEILPKNSAKPAKTGLPSPRFRYKGRGRDDLLYRMTEENMLNLMLWEFRRFPARKVEKVSKGIFGVDLKCVGVNGDGLLFLPSSLVKRDHTGKTRGRDISDTVNSGGPGR